MNKKLISLGIFLLVLVLVIATYFNKKNGDRVEINFFALDTFVNITLYEEDNEIDYDVWLDELKEKTDYYEGLFSRTLEGSDLYNINNRKNDEVEISIDTAFLMYFGKKYNKEVCDKFDISIGSLTQLWTDARENGKLPDENDILNLKESNSYKFEIALFDENMKEYNAEDIFDPLYKLVMEDDKSYMEFIKSIKEKYSSCKIKLKNDNSIYDFGAIAKGYIADAISYEIKSNNGKSGIINLGGNVLCIGEKTDGKDYNIGILKPFSDGVMIDRVEIKDKSCTTSGVYQRYVEIDNKIYSHILDKETGYPIDNELLSASIITNNSILSDCLSTTCMLLGARESEELINELVDKYGIGVEFVMVDRDFNILKESYGG